MSQDRIYGPITSDDCRRKKFKKKDFFSDNDPYVQIYLGDKKQKQTTTIKDDTKTPLWNESFVFNHLNGQDILHLDVYDKDFIFDDKIGSVKINLRDLYEKGYIDNWYNLSSRFGVSSHGQIHVILDYQPLRF